MATETPQASASMPLANPAMSIHPNVEDGRSETALKNSCLTGPHNHAKPDGCRAWTVVIGTFLGSLSLLGQVYSGGIFVVPLMQEFGTQLSDTSLVATMSLVMFYVMGLFATYIADYVGVRTMTTVGSIIWSSGWILGSFSTALWHSILTQGILCGIGVAMVYWPMVSVLPQWFKKYRASAMGMAVLGSGVGSIAMSFGGQQMITQLGWRNTLRVIGGIGSALLFFSVLLVDRRVAAARSTKGMVKGFFYASKDVIKFRNAKIFLASGFFFQFSFFVPYTYLASYSRSLGLSATFGGFALAMLGVGSSAGRIVFGPIADRFGRLIVYKVTMFLTVITLACWPACNTEASITAFAFLYGMFGSGFIAMFAVVATELWGPERLSGVFTLVNLVSIPGAFAAGPVIGAMVEASGSYNSAIGFTAAMMGVASILAMFVFRDKSSLASPLTPAAGNTPRHFPPSSSTSPKHSPDAGSKSIVQDLSNRLSSAEPNRDGDDLALKDLEAHLLPAPDYLPLLQKYHVDIEKLKHASDEERQMYIRAVELCRFRENFPDVPEDVFNRAMALLQENPFDAVKVKVQERFGRIPDEWAYLELAVL